MTHFREILDYKLLAAGVTAGEYAAAEPKLILPESTREVDKKWLCQVEDTIQHMQLQVVVDGAVSEDPASACLPMCVRDVKPLFRLMRGTTAAASHGIACAAASGLPIAVVQRAEAIMKCTAAGKAIFPVDFRQGVADRASLGPSPGTPEHTLATLRALAAATLGISGSLGPGASISRQLGRV